MNTNAYALYAKAMILRTEKQYRKALETCKDAITIDKKYPYPWNIMGRIHFDISDYKKALETGNTIQKAGLPGAYEILGNASLYLGNPMKAEEYLKKNPDKSIFVNYLMGFCFMLLDRHNEALVQMETILKEKPDHYGAYCARAALKFYLNQKLSLNKELKTGWGDQLDTTIFFSRGCVNASRQNWKAAESDWQLSKGMVQGFSIEGIDEKMLANGLTKNEMPYLNLGLLYYFKNHHDYALVEFKKAVKINKLSILSNYWAGQTLLLTGKRKEAKKKLKMLLKMHQISLLHSIPLVNCH